MSIRIIGGTLKGHIISSPKAITTRPILARVRKSLFDILRPVMQDAVFCDLFAGSGSVGIEAVSRGASSVDFVDKDTKVCKFIANNIKYCKIKEYCSVHCKDVFSYIEYEKKEFDIIFVGPPYPLYLGEQVLKSLSAGNIVKPSAKIILQHFIKEIVPNRIDKLICYRTEKYGDTKLSFFEIE